MTKTKYLGKIRNNRTRKSVHAIPKSTQRFERKVVIKFLEILNTIKLFHWKTYSYSTHKATDELYGKLNENIDKFVEVLLGKTGGRINLSKIHHISLKSYSTSEEIRKELNSFKSFLVNLENYDKTMTNTDLFNIRDEIMADINQFLYLLSFM